MTIRPAGRVLPEKHVATCIHLFVLRRGDDGFCPVQPLGAAPQTKKENKEGGLKSIAGHS
jgi:hypothetical protein